MQKLLISLLIASLMSGCAGYVNTNCGVSENMSCDDSQNIISFGHNNGDHYLVRDNLLFLAKNGVFSSTPARKEEVLDFALRNPGLVVMYDPISEIATIHRRVFDYQGNTGQVLLGLALLVVGTAAIVALAKSHETCYDKHISRYRGHQMQTNKNIFRSDEKGVGSTKWQGDIDVSHGNAMRELSQAFACLN